MSHQVVAKRSFGYAGQKRVPGEVFRLRGMRNDGRIREVGLVRDYNDKSTLECGECGAEFLTEAARHLHYERVHKE